MREAWKKIFHENGTKKRTGMAVFISDKIHLKSKLLQETKRSLYKDTSANLIGR